MTFTLPQLSYAYDALEPHIDTQTMEIHHSKHHQTYVDKLNAAVSANADWADKSIEELLQSVDILPSDIKWAVKNHGGGHWNHSFFWKVLTPGGKPMSEAFEKVIKASFGSVESFKEKFIASATAVFGSGWTWVIKEYDELIIKNTANQDNPLMLGEKAIFGIDVWEHAYYLKCQNRRPEYLANIWNVIDWEAVEANYNSKR